MDRFPLSNCPFGIGIDLDPYAGGKTNVSFGVEQPDLTGSVLSIPSSVLPEVLFPKRPLSRSPGIFACGECDHKFNAAGKRNLSACYLSYRAIGLRKDAQKGPVKYNINV